MSQTLLPESEDQDDAEGTDCAPGSLAHSANSGAPNYVTPGGLAALRAEFEHWVKTERPAIVQVVSWAAGNGDRSENGDYIYGKKRLREIDRRIRYLGRQIERARVVDPCAQKGSDQVFFGATVSINHPDYPSSTMTVQIVGVDEAHAASGKISWISPLARALMKARCGDIVFLSTPAGVREIEIVDIGY
jgi:transcription elongation factor GreB